MATKATRPKVKSRAAARRPRRAGKASRRRKGPTKAQIQELVGKALTDTDFRSRLSGDPVAAARELGIKFSPKQVNALSTMSPELEKYADGLRRKEELACGPGVLIPIADVAIVTAFA